MKRIWRKLRRRMRPYRGRRDGYVQKILDDETRHRLRSLTLSKYIDLIEGVPLPTRQQRENFVEFVSHAHSWYKHLPAALPGSPFYFFVDKYAGWDRVIAEDGTAAFSERAEQGFHYSAIPTGQYRTRFGHLAYSSDSGVTVFLEETPLVLPRDHVPAVPSDDAQMCGLPTEILKAGVAHLTAVIHSLSATRMPPWDRIGDWPEESGGQAALDRIQARARTMRQPTFEREEMEVDASLVETNPSSWMDLQQVDAVLYKLLAPERERQYAGMKKAIDGVCELIDGLRRQPTH